MTYNLSPSSLNLYNDCNRCFWLHLNEKTSRPRGIFPSIPNGMDKILKEYFDEHREKGTVPSELSALEGISLYSDIEKLKVWQNNWDGISWHDTKGNRLRGAVDYLLLEDDEIVVLDFKTRGFPLKEDTSSFYQLQMDCYNFLFDKNKEKVKDHAYLLFYIPIEADSGNVKFDTELVKMDCDPGNAYRTFRKALKVLEEPIPELNKDCNYCKYSTKLMEASSVVTS